MAKEVPNLFGLFSSFPFSFSFLFYSMNVGGSISEVVSIQSHISHSLYSDAKKRRTDPSRASCPLPSSPQPAPLSQSIPFLSLRSARGHP